MKLYHVSEEPDIKIFHPRPSPQIYTEISDNVVFAVNDKMLHNYLLPRDCPRITYYIASNSTQSDIEKFFGTSQADYIINVEEKWRERIENCTLYLYELPGETFTLLDKNAGYYISYKTVRPVSVKPIKNLTANITKCNSELRYLPSILIVAKEIAGSSLQYSIIRLRNAIQ